MTDIIALYDDDLDFDYTKKLLAEHGVKLVAWADASASNLASAVALLCSFRPVDDATLSLLPSLRLISLSAHESDLIDMAALSRRRIAVFNIGRQVSTEDVAVHTLAMILTSVRKLPLFADAVAAGEWSFRYAGGIPRLSTLTLGVIGFGRVGSHVANLCAPLFREILIFDPYRLDLQDSGFKAKPTLEELLREADVVSLHVPSLRGMPLIGRDQLSEMKVGAILVNCARASLLNQNDLLDALESGQIGFAALDVIDRKNHSVAVRLIEHRRTFITPHCAFFTNDAVDEYCRAQALNVVQFLESNHQDLRPYEPAAT